MNRRHSTTPGEACYSVASIEEYLLIESSYLIKSSRLLFLPRWHLDSQVPLPSGRKVGYLGNHSWAQKLIHVKELSFTICSYSPSCLSELNFLGCLSRGVRIIIRVLVTLSSRNPYSALHPLRFPNKHPKALNITRRPYSSKSISKQQI